MSASSISSPSVALRLITTPTAPGSDFELPVIVHALSGRADAVRLAPVIAALERQQAFRQLVVHAGDSDDQVLIGGVQDDLGLPAPDEVLEVTHRSDAELTAGTLTAFHDYLERVAPELVVLSGDTNATLACALAAAKLQIAVAHLESGLRSWDWTTPEEINRVVIDRLSDTLFAHSRDSGENLLAEGVPEGRIHAVGSTAVDSLRRSEAAARTRMAWTTLGVAERNYVLVTLHRPGTLAAFASSDALVAGLEELARSVTLIFPMHPRTRRALEATGGLSRLEHAGVRCAPPAGHIDFLSLQLGAGAILTDSAAVQEEASAIGVPCYTMRSVSERPVTLTHGTNVLLGDDPSAVTSVRPSPSQPVPCAVPLWDGRAGERAAEVIIANYAVRASVSFVR